MKRILKIGMDVHSTNYTLCAMEPVIGAEDRVFANIQVTPDYKNILMFIENLKLKLGLEDTYDIECGYEAGCLGYSLYNQLTASGVKCVILAPTTMLTQQGQRIKTDARDAHMIAQCLSYGGYHPVYIPTEEDDSVKEYLRMRDDHKKALKKVKQQVNAFCLRHGYHYEGTKWTLAHLKWLKKLELSALSLVVETGDFRRFAKGNVYAAYLGLAPGEHSSAEKINRLGITKAGNSHLRLLLVEAAGGICKGTIGHKSKELRHRQQGNSAEVISYADKANARMRSKYYRLIRHGKKRNIAVAAIARELACFVWGMVTENIEEKAA
ncbi:MAG: transposase [Lachnospiraceae bacterium]|nr:transposase [Lachnospiraceae bacterium]